MITHHNAYARRRRRGGITSGPAPIGNFLHTFTAADSPNVVPISDSGHVMTQEHGVWGINSGRLVLTTPNGVFYDQISFNPGLANYTVELDMPIAVGFHLHYLYRWIDDNNHKEIEVNPNQIVFSRTIAGVYGNSGGPAMVTHNGQHIKIIVLDDNVDVYFDGVFLDTRNDPAFPVGTKHAVSGYEAGLNIDNLSVV